MGFFNDLIMAPAWATAQDVGREYAATVSGAMNMVGNLVGAVSGIFFTGLIQKRYPSNPSAFEAVAGGAAGATLSDAARSAFQNNDAIIILFTTYTAVYCVGVGLWLMIDATKPIAPAEAQAGTSDTPAAS